MILLLLLASLVGLVAVVGAVLSMSRALSALYVAPPEWQPVPCPARPRASVHRRGIRARRGTKALAILL